jgi:hypothetical protein
LDLYRGPGGRPGGDLSTGKSRARNPDPEPEHEEQGGPRAKWPSESEDEKRKRSRALALGPVWPTSDVVRVATAPLSPSPDAAASDLDLEGAQSLVLKQKVLALHVIGVAFVVFWLLGISK